MIDSLKDILTAKSSLYYFLLGSVFFFLFIVVTVMVRQDLLRQFDFNMTVRLQDDIPIRLDPFFSTLSVIGRFEYTLPMLIIFLILKRKIIGGIIAFGLFGFAHVLELIGKTILEQPGPPRMFLRAQFGDFPGLHVFTEASYPSGHSLRAVFLTLLIGWTIWMARKLPVTLKLSLIAGLLGLLSVILVSRVSLGEHWTTDVIGGSLLGASFAFYSMMLIQNTKRKTHERTSK